MAPHSSTLAWKIPWTEEPGKLWSVGSLRVVNIHWIIEKARGLQENIYFFFIDYTKAFDCVDHKNLENSERDGNSKPPDLPPEKSVRRSRSNS